MGNELRSDNDNQRRSSRTNDPAPAKADTQDLHEGIAEPFGYSPGLLGNSVLNRRGNAPVRIALMQQMQQSHGNRAVQRFLQRSAAPDQRPQPANRSALSLFPGLGVYEPAEPDQLALEPAFRSESPSAPPDGGESKGKNTLGESAWSLSTNTPLQKSISQPIPVQRCGAEVHEGCACAEEKKASANMAEKDPEQTPVQTQRASSATAIPVQRGPNTPPDTPAPAPASGGGIQAPSGPMPSAGTIIKLPGASLFNVSKNIDVGKGAEGSIPLYDGLVEVPYIGPVKLDVKGTGKLLPSLVLSASGSLHDAQVQVPSTLAQANAKVEGGIDKYGRESGGSVGGYVRKVTGSETAGGLAGVITGGLVGGTIGGFAGAIKGGEAGMRAGAGLAPNTNVSMNAPMLGTAKLTAEGQAKGRLDGEVALEASANPTLLPGKGKIKVGLKGGLGLGAQGQATVGAQVGYDPEGKGKTRERDVPVKFLDGKLTLEKATLDLKASIHLDLRAIGFAEARILLGIGRFGDEKGKAGSTPGGAQGGAPAAPSTAPAPAPAGGGADKDAGADKGGGVICKKPEGSPNDGIPEKSWDDMTSIEKVWRKEWDLLNKEWKLWELNFSVSTAKTSDTMEALVESKDIKVIDANEWLSTIKKVGTAVANAPKALGAAKNALGLNKPANDNDCVADESPGAVDDDAKKAKSALGDRLFWREELQGILGLGKTATLSRINKWKAAGIVHQLASTTFDSETQYSFDATKAGQREVSPGNRSKYGFSNPAKTSTEGKIILSKGLRPDSPPPIESGSTEYHTTKARYDSKRSSAFKNFGFDDARLGHGPEGASSYWNRIGHTKSKSDNIQWNKDPNNYHGPEHRIESDASGGGSERYRIPSQLIGSHEDWL